MHTRLSVLKEYQVSSFLLLTFMYQIPTNWSVYVCLPPLTSQTRDFDLCIFVSQAFIMFEE